MTYFTPVDQRQHAKGDAGLPVSDWCANCGAPFMEHTNGECPADDEGED